MRKLMPLVAVIAVGFLAQAQKKCGDTGADICIGSKNSQVLVGGNLVVTSPDGGFTLGSTGAVTAPSTKSDVIDAGTLMVVGDTQLKGKFICGGTTLCGSAALSSASPSTTTVTVPTGASCACWPVGTTALIAAGGCAASVSSTTLTLTGPNSVTTTMRYMCFF